MRREIEQQDVVVDIHLLGKFAERSIEIRGARDWLIPDGVRIVDEDERAATCVETLVEERLRRPHLFHEHILGRSAGKTDEVELADARPRGRKARELRRE